jgi:subtilisin family serine protease
LSTEKAGIAMRGRADTRFRLAYHIIGAPSDPPRWAEEPRLCNKADFQEGTGTRVAVLDGGISRHPWLRGSYDEPLALDASDVWDLSAEALPRHIGHGTFVAGVLLQYAPQASLISRRVIDLDGHAYDSDLAAVINDLRQFDPDVVNLSLTPAVEAGTMDEGTSQTLAAVRGLQEDHGTIVVVAAGNDQDRFPVEHLAPQDELTVVVGALDLSGQPAWFSNREYVNIWAPGVDVISSFVHWPGLAGALGPADDYPGGHHDDGPDQDEHGHADGYPAPTRPVAPFAGWARWNGTSFAAPAVAGAIAVEVSRLAGVATRAERRRIALLRVFDAARDIDVDGDKSKALTAAPIALQGPPRG